MTPSLTAQRPAGPKIRVMLCDDSAVARGALTRLLARDGAIAVVAGIAAIGTAAIAATSSWSLNLRVMG